MFDVEELKILNKKNWINRIREERDGRCFKIINRNPIWYNTLTQERKDELMSWYQEWLDMPEKQELAEKRLPYPTKPSWL